MDTRDPSTIGEIEFEAGQYEFRITYYKLIIYAAMPIFLGFVAISIWYLILLRKNYIEKEERKIDYVREQLYDSFISTLVILLFLFNPNITNYMIDMFNC